MRSWRGWRLRRARRRLDGLRPGRLLRGVIRKPSPGVAFLLVREGSGFGGWACHGVAPGGGGGGGGPGAPARAAPTPARWWAPLWHRRAVGGVAETRACPRARPPPPPSAATHRGRRRRKKK